MTKRLKTTLIAAAALVLLGVIIFLIALAVGGFRASGLSSTVTANKVYTESADNPINSIIIDYENADVYVTFGDTLSVSYSELYTKGGEQISDIFLTDGSGNLSIRERLMPFKNIGFDATEPRITVTLPRDRAVSLNVETDNGDIDLVGNGLTVSNLVLNTDNGDVELSQISANKISVSTDNGSIEAKNLTATEAIKLDTENGEIDLEGSISAASLEVEVDVGDISHEGGVITANRVSLSTSVGEIEVTLAGAQNDYTIRVEKGLGASNVKTAQGGDKRLDIESEIGNITIRFAG